VTGECRSVALHGHEARLKQREPLFEEAAVRIQQVAAVDEQCEAAKSLEAVLQPRARSTNGSALYSRELPRRYPASLNLSSL
jgi:hypothetical protein